MLNQTDLIIIQHNPTEGLGRLGDWCLSHKLNYRLIHPFHGDFLPEILLGQRVIILGGPQNVGEPELEQEQSWIDTQVASHRPILGICLGAQMLAKSLGSKITKLIDEEWGWTPIQIADTCHPLFMPFREVEALFEWHSYQFSLPKGAHPLGSSDKCSTQGFVLNPQCVGVQFHPEWTDESLTALAKQSGDWPNGLKDCSLSNIDKLDRAMHEFLTQWWAFTTT